MRWNRPPDRTAHKTRPSDVLYGVAITVLTAAAIAGIFIVIVGLS